MSERSSSSDDAEAGTPSPNAQTSSRVRPSPPSPVHPEGAGTAGEEVVSDVPRPLLAVPLPAGGDEATGPARGDASAPAHRAPDLDDTATCYVCMENTSAESGGPPSRDLCPCSAAIHDICLEKLLNAKKMREKQLVERCACTVCSRPYTAQIAYAVLPDVLPTRLQRWMLSDCGRRYGQPMVGAVLFGLCSLFVWMLVNLSLLLTISLYGAVLVPLFVFVRFRMRRAANIHQLDDHAFYERAVKFARNEVANGREVSLEATEQYDSRRIVLIMRRVVKTAATAPFARRNRFRASVGQRGSVGSPRVHVVAVAPVAPAEP